MTSRKRFSSERSTVETTQINQFEMNINEMALQSDSRDMQSVSVKNSEAEPISDKFQLEMNKLLDLH